MKNLLSIIFILGTSVVSIAQSWTPSSPHIYFSGGNVGVGLSVPNSTLAVKGRNSATSWQNGLGIYSNTSTSASAIRSSISVTSDDNGRINLYNSATSLKVLLNTSGDSYFLGGNIGIGSQTPEALLHVRSTAVLENSTSKFDANLLIEGASSSRSTTAGAALGFVLPANTNGTNPWQQGRILVTPDNDINSRADGRMYLQTRYYGGASWEWRDNLVLRPNGNVGIGTETPSAILDVNGSSKFRDRINLTAGSGKGIEYAMDWVTYASASGDKLIFTNENTNGNEIVLQDIDGTVENSELKVLGKIRIGSEVIPNGFRLAVDGAAIMTEVKVEATPWPDYVFTPSYDLKSLDQVETFINENGHLPNIPSAHEVEENNGIELGEMNAKLLEKIEELTLHLIQQNKELSELKTQNSNLIKRIEKIESSVEK